jgi:hypothetical protein
MAEPAQLKVKNAAQALRAALDYFQERDLPQAPLPNLAWTEKTIYAEGVEDYAVTSKCFTSAGWSVDILQDVAPLSRTEYAITVFGSSSGWWWQGRIKADGAITETGPCQILPLQKRDEVEAEFLRKSRIPPPRSGGYGH